MLLVLLQNGWSRWYERIGMPSVEYSMRSKVWEREAWIDATWSCRSGQVLSKILKDVPDELIWLDDTTLELSPKASGACKPDLAHVRSVLETRNIKWVLACGKQAHATIDKLWRGPAVQIPHPACRVLSNSALHDYSEVVGGMVVRFSRTTMIRLNLDTRGAITELPGHNEVNNGCPRLCAG